MPRDVEFMHQLGGHESIDRYFRRQARRYQTFRMPDNLQAVIQLTEDLPRTQRAMMNEPNTLLRRVLSGFYNRVNETFITYGGSEEQHFINRYGNTDLVRDRIFHSSQVVRHGYVHDETNEARNIVLCNSNSYWNIYTLSLRHAFGMRATGVMCIGCGMGGTINPLDEGINPQ